MRAARESDGRWLEVWGAYASPLLGVGDIELILRMRVPAHRQQTPVIMQVAGSDQSGTGSLTPALVLKGTPAGWARAVPREADAHRVKGWARVGLADIAHQWWGRAQGP